MIRRKKKKTKKYVTTLQNFQRSPGGHTAKDDDERERFFQAYEYTCGNISAACSLSGISRTTIYRWLDSKEPHNVEFQLRLKEMRPIERLKDLAEGVLVAHLHNGSLDAAKYVLERKAVDRNYGRQVISKDEFEQVIAAVTRLQKIVEVQTAKNPDWKFDLRTYAEIAADDFKVPVEAIEKEYLRRQPQSFEGVQ